MTRRTLASWILLVAIAVNIVLVAPASASGAPGTSQPHPGAASTSLMPLPVTPTPTLPPGDPPKGTGASGDIVRGLASVNVLNGTLSGTVLQPGVVNNLPTLVAIDPGSLNPPQYAYWVHLDSFHVYNTRARHNDTDLASLTARQEPSGQSPSATWGPQDVNNGDHALGLVLGPFYGAPDDSNSLVFNYSIVNSGHSSADDVFNALIQAGLQAAGAPYGAPGSTLASVLGSLVGLLFANCDGVVVADQFGPFTGGQLASMTAAGPHSETHNYPGTDSPWGCGSNSRYSATWRITRGAP